MKFKGFVRLLILFYLRSPGSWQLSHLVNNRWWPLGMRVGRFSIITTILFWFKFSLPKWLMLFMLSITVILFIVWFRDITRESAYQGHHTWLVQGGLKWGLVWFLFREVWFFFRIFWRFFHYRLAPISGGWINWPNTGLEVIPPFQVPLLNTVILLIRGLTATLAHQELLKGDNTPWVLVRVFLGLYFLILQGIEYSASRYRISTGAYGRVFFFGTGFHGLHVCLGGIMLTVRALRLSNILITSRHHFGLEFSLWYWHFVDVVWLFLFFWVYAWGS